MKRIVTLNTWHECGDPVCKNWVFGTKWLCARCWQKFSMAHGDHFKASELSFDLQ